MTTAGIEHVSVRWPSGETQQFTQIEPGGRYLIVEGNDQPEPIFAKRQQQIALTPTKQGERRTDPSGRVVLANRLPMPLLRYNSGDGDETERIDTDGQPLLLTLWASWCRPCLAELKAITEHADELRAANLRVLALSVDGLDAQQSTSRKNAEAILSRIEFPFDTGMARRELLEKLELIGKMALRHGADPVVPASYLFDAQGDLAVIYRGPAELSQVQGDLALLDASVAERRDQAVPFAGRWLNPPQQLLLHAIGRVFEQAGYNDDGARFVQLEAERFRDRRAEASSEEERRELDAQVAAANYNMGLALVSEGQPAEALPYFRRAVEVVPTHRDALVNLGVLLARGGKQAQAIGFLQRALDVDPTSTLTRVNLAAALAATGNFQRAAAEYQSPSGSLS